jgi:uncharacterized integral membrane protein
MQPVQDDEPTIGKLVGDASRDISTLISKEIQLAKSELAVSVKAGGIGAGLFVGALFLLLIAVILGSMTIAYFIASAGLGLHWAFLIVTGSYVLGALLLAFIGFRSVKKVRGPERAISQAKANAAAFKR